MRPDWKRWYRWSVALSMGGTTMGIIQGLGMVNWATLFTQLFTSWLTALVTLLFGGSIPTT